MFLHNSGNDAKRKDIKRNEYWNVVCNIHTPKKIFLIKVGGQI
jgi:negative regulator of replication initiation